MESGGTRASMGQDHFWQAIFGPKLVKLYVSQFPREYDAVVDPSARTRAAHHRRARSVMAPPPCLIFPGGGIFFWWQAGAIRSLASRFHLEHVRTTGASAGALSATFAAASVDTDAALDRAISLSYDAGLFRESAESPPSWGLYGVWKDIIDTWLDELLPADAASTCSGRVHLAVNAVPTIERPWFETQLVSDFSDRRDLIDANLASVHVPLFLDRKWTATFRGKRYIDGSISCAEGATLLRLPDAPASLTLRAGDDARMRERYSAPTDFLKLASPDGVRQMVEWGSAHVDELDAAGGLEALEHLRL